MGEMMYTKAYEWAGCTVLVRRCLEEKPQHSGTKTGWILRDAIPSLILNREPCGAVGKAVAPVADSDVVAVWFLDPLPRPTRETVLFAHVDDLETTDQPYGWPDVPDMVVLEK